MSCCKAPVPGNTYRCSNAFWKSVRARSLYLSSKRPRLVLPPIKVVVAVVVVVTLVVAAVVAAAEAAATVYMTRLEAVALP